MKQILVFLGLMSVCPVVVSQGFVLTNNTQMTLYVEFKKSYRLDLCDINLGSRLVGNASQEEIIKETVEPGASYDWGVANFPCMCVSDIKVTDIDGRRIDLQGGSIIIGTNPEPLPGTVFTNGIPNTLFSCGSPAELGTYLQFYANVRQ